MTYDVDYFIKKFEAIPEEKIIIYSISDGNGSHCANGWCMKDFEDTDESNALGFLFTGERTYSVLVAEINNGNDDRYQQPTPKQRILAALYDIKKLNQGTEPSTERRNESSIKEPYVDQTKNFTQLIKVVEETSDCEVKIISE